MSFENGKATIKKDNNNIVEADLTNGIFFANLLEKGDKVMALVENKMSKTELWHSRLGHLNYNDIILMQNNRLVNGINEKIKCASLCKTCGLCKINKKPFNTYSNIRTTNLLQVIHTDVCGPIPVSSLGGAVYFITFTDDFSRYVTVYSMTKKSQAFSKLNNLKHLLKSTVD